MPTVAERNAQLEEQVNHLTSQLESAASEKNATDKQLRESQNENAALQDQLAEAKRMIAGHEAAGAPPVRQYDPDLPMWLHKYDGKGGTEGRLLPNEAAAKALQAREPDTWFAKGIDARTAFFKKLNEPDPEAPPPKPKAKAPAPVPKPKKAA